MGLNLESIVRRNFRKILLTSAFLSMFYLNCGEKKSPTAPEIPPSGNNPPTVEITSGPSGTISQNYATFSWRGSDTDGQVVRYYRDLDDSTPDIETNETSFTFTNLSDGNHNFYVKAEDNDNTPSQIASRSFRVETSQPPEEEIQNGISDSNGRVNFSDTDVQVINKNTRQPIQNISVTYYDYNNAKVFISADQNETYFPAMDLYTHNSDHTLELTPVGALNYISEQVTGESLQALHNFLGFVMTNANCQSGPNITFNGTVTGEQFYNYNHIAGGLVLRVFDTLGFPFSDIVSTIEDLGVRMRDPTTGIDYRITNWDKYVRTDPPSIISQFIYIPSNAPSINQYQPEVSENSVTLTFTASDNWTYSPPYSSIEDATIECLPSSNYPNNDFLYWFKIPNTQYSNWTPMGSWTTSNQKTVTVTNLPPGDYEAQGRVKDDTNINESASEIMPFSIEGSGGLEIIATYDGPATESGEHLTDIAWDGSNMWSCVAVTAGTDKIYKHRSDMSIIEEYNGSWSGAIYGLTWGGSNMWSSVSLIGPDAIYKHRSDMSIIEEYDSPAPYITALTWNGSNMWSCSGETYKIYKHRSDMSIIEEYDTPSLSPTGLAFDGNNIWSCDNYYQNSGKIYKHGLDMIVIEEYDSPGDDPQGLTWDGSYLWNAAGDDNKIYQLRVP